MLGKTQCFVLAAAAFAVFQTFANAQESALPGDTQASLVEKAEAMSPGPLSSNQIQTLFGGNTLTYEAGDSGKNIYMYFLSLTERVVEHPNPARGRFTTKWDAKQDGIFCIGTFNGGESCRKYVRVSVKDGDVIVRMTYLQGRNEGRVKKGQLLPGNQLE